LELVPDQGQSILFGRSGDWQDDAEGERGAFFGSGSYSIIGPYMAEIWPARLRASGMGLAYGAGKLGKFIGPAGLALIRRLVQLRQPAGDGGRFGPGHELFRPLVRARACRGFVLRLRDTRSHDRGD